MSNAFFWRWTEVGKERAKGCKGGGRAVLAAPEEVA